MTPEDKKNNRDVKAGKIRGKITMKLLSVRMANNLYHLNLIQKNNDEADAVLLGRAFCIKTRQVTQ